METLTEEVQVEDPKIKEKIEALLKIREGVREKFGSFSREYREVTNQLTYLRHPQPWKDRKAYHATPEAKARANYLRKLRLANNPEYAQRQKECPKRYREKKLAELKEAERLHEKIADLEAQLDKIKTTTPTK